MLHASGVDHLARDHLEVALLLAVSAAHVAAVEPDHDGAGRLRHRSLRGPGGVWLHDRLADPPRPVPHRAGVPRPAERQQLGQERGDLAEWCEGGVLGRHVGQLGGHGTSAEVEGGEALRLTRAPAGADQPPPDPDRHRAEQRTEGRAVVPLAGQHSPTGGAAAATLAHDRHLAGTIRT